MVNLLYSFFLFLYHGAVHIHALFNSKSKLFLEGRTVTWSYLDNTLNNDRPLIWIHCASAGEYEQGKPLMEAIKKEQPGYTILLTFYSPSGYEAVHSGPFDYKCYLPTDYRHNARKFIEAAQPAIAIFVKYEFWSNYLYILSRKSIPTYSVSAVFNKDFPYFKWYGGFYRTMLRKINFFLVQDEVSKLLLNSVGLEATITGDSRVDRVVQLKSGGNEFPIIKNFIHNSKVMIVGSVRKMDLPVVVPFIESHPDMKFIIAPHEIEGFVINQLEKMIQDVVKYSAYQMNQPTEATSMIIDNIGMLSRLYQYGDFAYIGGAFDNGLHNILEPAVHQIPIFFGNKKFESFTEAIDLIDLGVAFPVGSTMEFSRVFDDLYHDDNRISTIQRTLDAYIRKNEGATNRIMQAINFNIR